MLWWPIIFTKCIVTVYEAYRSARTAFLRVGHVYVTFGTKSVTYFVASEYLNMPHIPLDAPSI